MAHRLPRRTNEKHENVRDSIRSVYMIITGNSEYGTREIVKETEVPNLGKKKKKKKKKNRSHINVDFIYIYIYI
jgi:hypothetical protein